MPALNTIGGIFEGIDLFFPLSVTQWAGRPEIIRKQEERGGMNLSFIAAESCFLACREVIV